MGGRGETRCVCVAVERSELGRKTTNIVGSWEASGFRDVLGPDMLCL